MKPLNFLFIGRAGLFLPVLLFFCLFMVKATHGTPPLIVHESLIGFSPPVQLPSGASCQGIRIARQLLATSKLCAQVINKKAESSVTQVLDADGKAVGNIITAKGEIFLNPMDQDMLFYIPEAVSNEFDSYPGMITARTAPATTYAYFKNDDNEIIQTPVETVQLKPVNGHPGFDISSETELPPGTVVMDGQHNIVCLIHFKNQCLGLNPGQSVLTRKLEQYSDENDESDDVFTTFEAPIVEGIVALGLVAGALVTFYIVTFARSRQLGIPAGAFLKGMCSFSYCSGWSSLSTVLCLLGTICFLPTGGYSGASCWSAALAAAWNWMNIRAAQMYAPLSGLEARPAVIIHDPPTLILPQ